MSANTRHAHPPPPRVAQVIAITNYIVALFPFTPLLAAALLSFVPCTACSGSPHNATHFASNIIHEHVVTWW